MHTEEHGGVCAASCLSPARLVPIAALLMALGTQVAAATEAAAAPTTPYDAGRYRLTAQLLMPHLDEMRRTSSNSEACLAPSAPEALFPVFAQYALGGCRLGYPKASADGIDYVLVCASARVASGTAHLARGDAGVIGTLAVKMGGKNMTFTQRVVAARTGDCTAAEAAAVRPDR